MRYPAFQQIAGVAVCLAFFRPGVAMALSYQVASYSPAQDPERYTLLRELQGTVRRVDMREGFIYVEDRQGRQWRLTVDDYTTISKTSDKRLQLKGLKEGDPVYLYYTSLKQRALRSDPL